ncbi:MAG: hypothetical protein WBE35_16615, partial [Candidatus Cybelea sp.]
DLQYPVEPLWRLGERRPSDEAIDLLVDRLMREHDALSVELESRREALQAAAERNFDVLGELLG